MQAPVACGSRCSETATTGRRCGPAWRACTLLALVGGVVSATAVPVPVVAAPADAGTFAGTVAPFVRKYCLDCHGTKNPEGKLSLDDLSGDLSTAGAIPKWYAAWERVAGREMPPRNAEQPTPAERDAVLRAMRASLRGAGVVLDEGKWLAPSNGNHVDHLALFSGKPTTTEPAGTSARLWRLAGPAYEESLDKLIRRFVLPVRNYGEHRLTAPWNFTPQRDFPDYAAVHRVGEAEIEGLLRNATILAAALVKRHSGSVPSYGGYVKELAVLVKADRSATPAQAEAALAPTFRELVGRPPTEREVERYGTFLKKNVESLGGAAGAEQLLIALLCQTERIHRVEVPVGSGKRERLAPRALARAVSFTLTDGVPDEPLATAAEEGKLATREEVAAQVRRLLDDPAVAKPRILRFFREYFAYDAAPGVFKDEQTLSERLGVRGARGWNPDYFVSDADRLVLSVLQDDAQVLRTLLTTTKTFVATNAPADQQHTKADAYRLKKPTFEADEQTAFRVYELPIAARSDWDPHRAYDLPAEHRRGLLTHPAWLVARSGNFDNHAIHRGRWIRERLLGGRIPDVPITVNAMLPDEPHRTLRDRMQVTRKEYCWNCHSQMDPLGLPFEQFDHFGRFRGTEQVVDQEATQAPKNLDKNGQPRRRVFRELPLDTTGEVVGSIDPALDGPVKDPFELIDRLARSEHVEQVFVRHAFRYFLGRNETPADGPVLVEAQRAYRQANGSFEALVVSLLTSDVFLHRTVE